ncbi:MAG: HAMP domain-containing protein, partial [Anaerolineae bacterium]|nr:HAMP domain-containing protein [Anaerolineae bacterium]
MTIRTRLTFLYASLLAIAMLVFSAATLSVLNWMLRDQVDNTLIQAADDIHAEAVLSALPAGSTDVQTRELLRELSMRLTNVNAPGLFVQIWVYDPITGRTTLTNHSWNLLGIGYNNALDPHAIGYDHEVRRDRMIEGYHLRVMTTPLVINGEVRGYIQTAASLHTVDAAIDRLTKIMLIGGTAVLLLALLLGDYLTRHALLPIDTIAQTAQQITAADDLSRRIPYDGPHDELGQLTHTFNKTLERLEQLFNVQRRFVADVSHEMRTPLTTIRGNMDLMRRYGADEEMMVAIESEARRMSRLVDDLLLLAKADVGRLTMEHRLVSVDTLVLEVYNQARLFSETISVQL